MQPDCPHTPQMYCVAEDEVEVLTFCASTSHSVGITSWQHPELHVCQACVLPSLLQPQAGSVWDIPHPSLQGSEHSSPTLGSSVMKLSQKQRAPRGDSKF